MVALGEKVKLATGATGFTVTDLLALLVPPALLAVRVTVNVPAAEYVWVGFSAVLVEPSPKVQDQEVGEPVEVSVNVTNWPALGLPGESVKEALGGGIATVMALLALLEPPALLAVRETVKLPAVE